MHHHLEVIMPPTDHVEVAITAILRPFDENLDRYSDDANGHPFWDWWVIGGRWSATKILPTEEELAPFYQKLQDANVTVSSVRAGKQTLRPPEQAELVDNLWNETFPDSPVKTCPIFDNYDGDSGDVLPLSAVDGNLKAGHVIIAGPNWDNTGLSATFMVTEDVWNGVNHQQTTWDGTIAGAIAMFGERTSYYKQEWKDSHTPGPDWLVVTVDYHS